MAAAVVRFLSCLAHSASASSMMAAAQTDGVARVSYWVGRSVSEGSPSGEVLTSRRYLRQAEVLNLC
jgi:hypothetical protein